MDGNSSQECSGTSTPMTDSSCEFVNIGDAEIADAKENTKRENGKSVEDEQGGDSTLQAAEEEAAGSDKSSPAAVEDVDVTSDANKDEELRHLMGILQERVRSGSPSHSVISTDSDFIHLPGVEREPEELMDLSTNSSAGSRFNIIVNRDVNQLQHSDIEDEDMQDMSGEELAPDADDRVESDIVMPQQEVPEREERVAHLAVPVRHYIHSPNRHLNTVLTSIALTALGFAIGIALGHWIGSAREAHLQQEIQEGQKLRLRSVQDDLLMCLRKQEDIDQTINKLNEIENILVDAEHWRNEYEELLNIKLQNEEKWRIERTEMTTSLSAVEKSYDVLLNSKSCAHDNEYLSRQESTLRSVHEKLEASLTDKDQLIEKLQIEVLDLKVKLLTAEQMVTSYRKSNEDKSLLILGLKEQLLVIERQMFDLQINSDVEQQNGSADSEDIGGESDLSTDRTANTDKDNTDSASSGEIEAAGGSSTDINADSDLSEELNTGSDTSTAKHDMASEETANRLDVDDGVAADDPHAAVRRAQFTVQPVDDPELSDLTVEEETVSGYKHTIGQLQEEIISLQLKIRSLEFQLSNSSLNSSQCNSSHSSNQSMCIVLNFCDHFNVNISRDQILEAYEATKGRYSSLQSFLLSEWRSLTGSFNQSKPTWHKYLNHTKSVVTEFLDTMNSTWQSAANSTTTEGVQAKFAKKTDKLQKRLTNIASVISRGVGVVTEKLANVFDNSGQRADKTPAWGESGRAANGPRVQEDVERDSSEGEGLKKLPKYYKFISKQPKVKKYYKNKKFQHRLEKLEHDLNELNMKKVNKMKKREKKDMAERFEDFNEDYSFLFDYSEIEHVGIWAVCQTTWWKRKAKGQTEVDGLFDSKCASSLMPWQQSALVREHPDNFNFEQFSARNWQFERAEMRQYHRDEPDDWYWRRSHDYEPFPDNVKASEFQYTKDEL